MNFIPDTKQVWDKKKQKKTLGTRKYSSMTPPSPP